MCWGYVEETWCRNCDELRREKDKIEQRCETSCGQLLNDAIKIRYCDLCGSRRCREILAARRAEEERRERQRQRERRRRSRDGPMR